MKGSESENDAIIKLGLPQRFCASKRFVGKGDAGVQRKQLEHAQAVSIRALRRRGGRRGIRAFGGAPSSEQGTLRQPLRLSGLRFNACSSSSHASASHPHGSPEKGPPGCSVCALLSCSRTPRAQTARSTSGFALVRHGCGMPPQAGIPCSWRTLAPPPSNPSLHSVSGNGEQAVARSPFPLAEGEGFEPPEAFTSTVFKTAAIDRSAILPYRPPQKAAVFCCFQALSRPFPSGAPHSEHAPKRRPSCKTPFPSGAPLSEPVQAQLLTVCAEEEERQSACARVRADDVPDVVILDLMPREVGF